MRGFMWFFGLLLVGLIGGAIGYNIGISANLAAAGTAVAVPVYGWGFGFGFPIFGLIFGIFFLFLVFGLIGRMAFGRGRGWGYGGPGGPWAGRHGWDGKTVPPPADEMLQRWHRQAHGEEQPPAAS